MTTLDRAPLQALRDLQRPGRPSVLARIIVMFNSDAPRLLGEMDKAASGGDAEALRLAAHTLASTCGNVGATELRTACRDVEQAARNGDLAGVPERIGGMRAQLEQVLTALAREKEPV